MAMMPIKSIDSFGCDFLAYRRWYAVEVALKCAEIITQTERQLSEDLIVRLSEHFDEGALIELTALLAFQNLSSKFNAALDIPSQRLCRTPDEHIGLVAP